MKNVLKQLLPLFLTVITFLVLSLLLFFFIHILNLFPVADKIMIALRFSDILVGLTIYLKTSVDFALFIGMLMGAYHGIKNRIAIEIGTAVGNALGTFFVLCIWTFFKEVPFLMICMITLASLVLFRMSEEGLGKSFLAENVIFVKFVLKPLQLLNAFFYPAIHFIFPKTPVSSVTKRSFLSLLLFSLTIPLILGLDDFAGYIPLFNIVNVFGFALGVFLGHMILNAALFASPKTTIQLVEKPIIAFVGSVAFLGIGLWGFVEAAQIVPRLFPH